MKILLKLISVFILLGAGYYITGANDLKLDFAILSAGFFSGALWVASFYVTNKIKLKEYQRKLEKTSVSAESESSKVSVLEAKIEVLEKALQSALEKNND